MAKYSIPDDYEWSDEKEDDDPDPPTPRVEINTHSVVIDRHVDEEYIQKYRYRFAIEGQQVVGWTRSDIEHNGTEDYANHLTWETLPASVKGALATALNIRTWEGHLDLPDHLRGDGRGE